MAQRVDMHLSHVGSYTYRNDVSNGGLSRVKDRDVFTRWLWNDARARDMGMQGSHHIKVWGPCFWAREVLGWARTSATGDMLDFSGWGPAQDRHGHEYTADGVPVIREEREDTPGHRLDAELAFAIGAGILDRSYVARRGQSLWFAPLEVVSTPEGRHAALAPGHEIAPGSRFTTPITPECLGCHTDSPPPAGLSAERRARGRPLAPARHLLRRVPSRGERARRLADRVREHVGDGVVKQLDEHQQERPAFAPEKLGRGVG